MDKNKIKSYLSSNFLTEAKETADKPVGLKKTEDIQKANKSINAASLKDVAKDIKANDKALTANKTTNAKEVKKRELDKGEKETHDNVELFQDTMLALDYDSPVDAVFKDRFEKSLAGHPTMGNSSEYANVVQDKVWGGDPNFGQSLVDKTKEMAKVQQNVVGGGNTMLPYGVKNGNYAMNESTEMGAENIQWEVKPIKGHSLEKNTHFAIHKQTNAIADSWDLSDRMPRKPKPPIDKSNKRAVSIYKNKMVDYKEQIREFSDDLKLDADYFFYDDLRDGCGANMDKFKKSDFAIVTKDGLLKRGFDLNNYNYFVGQKYGEPENNQEMPMVDNNNNKPQIKEGMKRLKFKNPFNGLNNALDLIPESYRVDDKEFEMTDGNESYKVRWEGTLTEGRAIVLMGSSKEQVNEDIAKIKHLMGYSSEKSLGTLKGNQRLDENKRFADIWGKTKSLLIESEDIDGQDAPEGEWDEETKKAAEATKHVEGSVSKEKNFPNTPAPKHGQFADVKKKATEATKDVEGSVANEKNYPNTPAVKTGEWDKNVKGQAADAKKHIHMHESYMNALGIEDSAEYPNDNILILDQIISEELNPNQNTLGFGIPAGPNAMEQRDKLGRRIASVLKGADVISVAGTDFINQKFIKEKESVEDGSNGINEYSQAQIDTFDGNKNGKLFDPEDMEMLQKEEEIQGLKPGQVPTLNDIKELMNQFFNSEAATEKTVVYELMQKLFGHFVRPGIQTKGAVIRGIQKLMTIIDTEDSKLGDTPENTSATQMEEGMYEEDDRFNEIFKGLDEEY